MTMWLSNVLAYSAQLAAIVGVAVLFMTLGRVTAPRASLRFWQVLFATSMAWPIYQLIADTEAALPTFAGAATFASSRSIEEIGAQVNGIDSRLTIAIVLLLTAGAIVRCAWIAFGLLKLRVIRAESQPAESLSVLANTLQRDLGVTAAIRLSDAVPSPATIGARRPIVLLPPQVCALPESVQRAVLVHELIHVQRRDWIAALAEEIWCAVLWFHPAARVLASRLSLARETLVDEATLAYTRDRGAYAAALLHFSGAPTRLAGAAPLIGTTHLERRISVLAQEVPMARSALTLRLSAAATAVAVAAIMTTSAFPLAAAPASQAQRVYRPSEDKSVTLPQVTNEVKPEYTPAAMQARIQGTVWLLTVVLPNGDVGEVTVSKSLDKEYGLDDAAIAAARQWKFRPGTKDGKPVAVEVTIELTFTLK